MPVANPALREHVTRIGFDLSLAKSHIAALVWLDVTLAHPMAQKRDPSGRTWMRYVSGSSPHRRAFAMFVPGVRGLIDRGLAWHEFPPDNAQPWAKIYGITSAGHHVIALLKESGIYQEFEAEIPMQETA